MIDDNFKDHLMRYCQTNGLTLPDYRVITHDNGVFMIDVYVDDTFLGRGCAKSKKQAEQYAAQSYFYPPNRLKRVTLLMNNMHPNVKAALEREYAAQKSEEWLALRGKMLTASDAATAIGKNKYETPAGLLLKKCGLGEKIHG